MPTIAPTRKSTSHTQKSSISTTPTHSIHIKKVGDDEVEPDPFPEMSVGDTVRYFTNAKGEVSIEFPGPSPFRRDHKAGTTVPGEVIMTVVSKSTGLRNNEFKSHCFITLPNGEKIGWGPNYPKAGAGLHVPRP